MARVVSRPMSHADLARQQMEEIREKAPDRRRRTKKIATEEERWKTCLMSIRPTYTVNALNSILSEQGLCYLNFNLCRVCSILSQMEGPTGLQVIHRCSCVSIGMSKDEGGGGRTCFILWYTINKMILQDRRPDKIEKSNIYETTIWVLSLALADDDIFF